MLICWRNMILHWILGEIVIFFKCSVTVLHMFKICYYNILNYLLAFSTKFHKHNVRCSVWTIVIFYLVYLRCTMVKTRWYDGENAMTRCWNPDSVIARWWQRDITLCFHYRTNAPSRHCVSIIVPMRFHHRAITFHHHVFTIVSWGFHHCVITLLILKTWWWNDTLRGHWLCAQLFSQWWKFVPSYINIPRWM
jgi:hypothetical protein